MIFMVICRKVKSLLLFICHLFQRCFCCFRRKLNADDFLPITIEIDHKEVKIPTSEDNTFTNWDPWDGLSSVVSDGSTHKELKLTPLQQQIELYRLNQQKKLTESTVNEEEEEESNYFQDLAPKINRKPKIVILARSEEEQHISNRISLSLLEPALQGSELLEWNEDSGRGWEEESEQDLNLDSVLREQKDKIRQEKKAERLKRKADKDINKVNLSKLATKIS